MERKREGERVAWSILDRSSAVIVSTERERERERKREREVRDRMK